MRQLKKITALLAAVSLVFSNIGVEHANAASKPILKMKKSSYSVDVGKTCKISYTKKNIKKVKSESWSTSSKKIAAVNKKGIAKGINKGKTTIKCKIKYILKGKKKG